MESTGSPQLNGGQLDGEKEAGNKLEEIKAMAIPMIRRLTGTVSIMKPWKEFFTFTRPRSSGEMSQRISKNLFYYQGNYGVCAVVLLLLWVLTTPSALFLCLLLVASWVAFLNKNSDPNWNPQIGGVPLNRTQRMLAMTVVSGALVLVLAGGLIVTVLCLSGILAVAHATFNSGAGKFEELAEEDLPLNAFKMKIRRQKSHRKVMRFYQTAFGFQEPYRALIDGTFIDAALKSKVHIKEQLPKLLGGRTTPVVTECVYQELRDLGADFSGSAIIARGYYRLKCGHTKGECSAADCITKQLASNNPKQYLVCTQDKALRERVRRVPGAGLIILHGGQVPIIEQPSEASMRVAAKQENEKQAVQSWEKSKLPILRQEEAKAEAMAGDARETSKKKRRGPRAPNPLSCKKRKVQAPAGEEDNTQEQTTTTKQKRTRSRRRRQGGGDDKQEAPSAATADAAES
ncbi:Small subunit processome component [Perkinsus olseni]|uniref:Small subunit processome component n=1 Tax=Perkinsus olseni TaxID=32597 RepID=A0A7J6L4B4_PEROL|nr:Small subunit processome component [Perkinsus olseni]